MLWFRDCGTVALMPVRMYITSAKHSRDGAHSAVRVLCAMRSLCRNTKDHMSRGMWDDFPQPLLAASVVKKLLTSKPTVH